MRERINRLARGILSAGDPELVLAPERIDLPVRKGEVLKTEIAAESGNGIHLKGLVYSDSVRVRVLRPAFGGRKNRIAVEADARFLEPGDRIEGSLRLVTNAGEREIPFCFRVTDGTAAGTLEHFRTIEDFALIAKADPESALRIFEYRYFVSAPFMQDMRTRALYEAFRGGPDRQSAMEEFLVAAGAKKPALVRAETEQCSLRGVAAQAVGSIVLVIVRQGWFRLSVRAEGGFITLPVRTVTPEQFQNGAMTYSFAVDSAKLHAGRNEGRVCFFTDAFAFSVPVTVFRAEEPAVTARKRQRLEEKRRFAGYLEEKLAAFTFGTPDRAAGERMLAALEGAGGERAEQRRNILLKAEAAYIAGRPEQAKELIAGVEGAVQELRQTGRYEYALMEALKALLPGGEERRSGALRLVRKYLEEGVTGLLPVLSLLAPEAPDDAYAWHETLAGVYDAGSRSPFLYAELLKAYEKTPALLKTLGNMELSVLRFALDHAKLSKAAAGAFTQAAGSVRTCGPMQVRLLERLYERHPSAELLTVICTALIRMDDRTEKAFRWYSLGIRDHVRLTGLNEYLLYSMPEGMTAALPHEVFLYFAYDNRLDDRTREKLYENMCLVKAFEPALWEEYRRQIEDYTFMKLLTGSVNRRLAVLYREVLSESMIDRRLAGPLPAVLNARHLTVRSSYIRSAVIVYPELAENQKQRIENGTAYIPVFTDDAVFLFEDAYGNRYADIPWKEEKICDMPALMERCTELDPDGPVAMLRTLKRVTAADAGREGVRVAPGDVRIIRTALSELRLSEPCRRRLVSILAEEPEESLDFLVSLDRRELTAAETERVITLLIERGRLREAWEIAGACLVLPQSTELLSRLCSGIVLDRMFAQDEVLLKCSEAVFLKGRADAVLTDYLCEHLNDSTEIMFRLFESAVKAGSETYDLGERLLAQMLFTGEKTHLDQVFTWYRGRGQTSEAMVRAYMTDRAAAYFLDGAAADAGVFRYLEMLVDGSSVKDKVPTIYQLALTKFYSDAETLSDEQKARAEQILSCLLDEGLCFPYYKNLARFIPVPEEIMDKACVEFRGKTDAEYEIRMRILPDETEFRTEKLARMYRAIYVKREVLFDGEVWEYEILEAGGGTAASGRVREKEQSAPEGSRFACLNGLSEKLRKKDDAGLRRDMEAFASDEDLAAELFRLI